MNNIEISRPDEAEIIRKGIRSWPVWKKEVSRFDHTYDEDEYCLFLEGEVVIESGNEVVILYPGDFVIFRKGLQCIWDIRQPVKKHYHFE
jgi:uncharacterized protein